MQLRGQSPIHNGTYIWNLWLFIDKREMFLFKHLETHLNSSKTGLYSVRHVYSLNLNSWSVTGLYAMCTVWTQTADL